MNGSLHPKVTIQIVTWNSAEVIDDCLKSLAIQTSEEFELIVVDNGSTDDSAERVTTWFTQGLSGTLLREPLNRGFCAAQNQAFRASQGDLILFLNPDAILPPSFIAQAITIAEALPLTVGTIAPRILLPDGRIDSTGLRLDRLRRVYDRGYGESGLTSYQQEEDVFGCTGAVALHRRQMLEDVAVNGAVLDEALFAYCDDMDLAWRARLLGWRCRYIPSLVAVHCRAARNALRGLQGRTTRRFEQSLTVRNRLLVIAKCERLRNLLFAFPQLLLFEILRVIYLAIYAPGALRGYTQALALMSTALRDRRQIQSRMNKDRR